MKVIKFGTNDCNDCIRVDNYLNANDYVINEVINPFENPEKAVEYDIGSIPVVIKLDDDGKEVTRSIGFKPSELELIFEN